jgi:type II secretory pathway component GspD/PulD (secretin)
MIMKRTSNSTVLKMSGRRTSVVLVLIILLFSGLGGTSVPSLWAQETPPAEAEAPPAVPETPPATESPSDETTEAPAESLSEEPVESVEPPVEEPVPSEPIELPDYDPESSFTRLLYPGVAAAVRLTDEQKAEVQRLIGERSQLLAAAESTPEAWMAIITENEEKLRAILLPDQLEGWPDRLDEKMFRFSYYHTPWAEVLQTFADHADLSLVLDAPPPGTFNYIDPREYNAEDSIDILNGVLMMKGYTLVRRDRMLIVFNFTRGIPWELIPMVDEDDLDLRGNFEYCQVSFRLGRKVPEHIIAAVTPMLGPYGKTRHISTTRTLIISDTAGAIRPIAKIIASIPEPPLPERPPKPVQREEREPERPVAEVYPIQHPDMEMIIGILDEVFGGASIVPDEEMKRIIVYAVPSQQSGIQRVLETLDKPVPEGEEPELESYSLDPLTLSLYDAASGSTLGQRTLEAVQDIVPRAQLTIHYDTNQLVALASPSDHVLLANTVATLTGRSSGTEETKSVEVYPFMDGIPANFSALLAELVPDVTVAIDLVNNRVMALAEPQEHARIQQALVSLQATIDEPEESMLIVYPVTNTQRTRFLTLARHIYRLPDLATMQVVDYTDPKEIAIWGTTEQHEKIAAMLEQFGITPTTDLTGEPPHIELHRLTTLDEDAAEEIIQNFVPDAQVTVDDKTGNLIVIATPLQQELIREALSQIQSDGPGGPDAPVLQFHAVVAPLPSEAVSALEQLAPRAAISEDDENLRLMVLAPPSEQAIIAEAIATIEASAAPESAIQFHAIREALPSEVMTLLEEQVPTARITVDLSNRRLVVLASAEDHATIAATITTVEEATPDVELRFYPMNEELSSHLMDLVEEAAPSATITWDNEQKYLIVTAVPADHTDIETLLQAIASAEPVRPILKYYPWPRELTSAETKAMDELTPGAQLTYESENRRFMIFASDEDYLAIEGMLQTFAAAEPAQPELEYYPLDEQLSSEEMQVLQDLIPDAEIRYESEDNRLMVLALSEDQALIAPTLEKFAAAVTSRDEVRGHDVPEGVSDALLDLLRRTVSGADIQVSRNKRSLIVIASPTEHDLITKTLVEAGPQLVEERDVLRIYSVTQTQRTRFDAMRSTLTDDIGDFRMVDGGRSDELTILATEDQHTSLAAVLEELAAASAPDADLELIVHRLQTANASTVEDTLADFYPDARVQYEETSNRLLIWVPSDQAEAVRATIAQLEGTEDDAEPRRFALFELAAWYGLNIDRRTGDYEYYSIVNDLRDIVPNANLSVDRYTNSLLVYGTEQELEAIDQAVERLKATYTERRGTTEVYPITKADPDMLVDMLEERYADAEVTYDEEGSRLIVEATTEEHAGILELINKLQPPIVGSNDPTLRFYDVDDRGSDFLISGLKILTPTAEVTLDEEGGRLMVIATPIDHRAIADNLEDILSTLPGADDPRLVVYPVESGWKERLQAFLESVAPDLEDITVVDDDSPSAVSVWASMDEHELIGEVLAQWRMGDSAEGQAELRVFQFVRADSEAAADILQDQFEEIEFVVDENTNRLLAWALPAELERVQQAVDELDAETLSENTPRFESFTIPGLNDEATSSSRYLTLVTLRENLREIAPNAKVTLASDYRRLVVWGTPQELEIIRSAFEQYSSPENAPTVKTYPLVNMDYRLALMAFGRLTPSAVITFDYMGGRMIALASADDHRILEETTTALMASEPAPNAHRVGVYPVKDLFSGIVIEGLEDMAPRAEIFLDRDERQIVVIGNEMDQQRLGAAIEELNASISEASVRRFETFTISGLDATSESSRMFTMQSIESALDDIVPGARIVFDEEVRKLVVFGNQEELDIVRGSLEALGRNADDANRPELKFYDIGPDLPEDLVEGLAAVVPDARLTPNESDGRLMVLATAAEQQMVTDVLADLEATGDPTSRRKFAAYDIDMTTRDTTSSSYVTMVTVRDDLRQLIPSAHIMVDGTFRKIVVFGTQDELDIAAEAIEGVGRLVSPENEPRIETYDLAMVDPETTIEMLEDLIQDDRSLELAVDVRTGKLVALGTPDTHQKISDVLTQLSADATGSNVQEMEYYSFTRMPPESFVEGLQQLVPHAELTLESNGLRLMAIAVPGDHEKIDATITRLEAATSEEELPRFESFIIRNMTSDEDSRNYLSVRTVYDNLSLIVPGVQLTYDSRGRQLIAYGTPAELDVVRDAVEHLVQGASAESTPYVEIYDLSFASDPRNTGYMVYRVAPLARMTYDFDTERMIVWAVPEDHKGISEMLGKIKEVDDAGSTNELRIYTLQQAPPDSLIDGLVALIPKAEIDYDDDAMQLVVVAIPEDHDAIQQTLDDLDSSVGAGAQRLVAYSIGQSDPEAMQTMFQEQFPSAKVEADERTRRLLIWATPEEHTIIMEAIEAATGGTIGVDMTEKFIAYPLNGLAVETVLEMLETLVPYAETQVDENTEMVIVYGLPDEQAVVSEIFEKLQEAEDEKRVTLVVYPCGDAEPEDVAETIRAMMQDDQSASGASPYSQYSNPYSRYSNQYSRFGMYGATGMEGTVRADGRSRTVAVLATPEQHVRIQGAVEALAAAAIGTEEPTAKAYTFSKLNAGNAIGILQNVVPDAELSVGSGGYELIVYGDSADHAKVQVFVEQVNAEGGEGVRYEVRTYPIVHGRMQMVIGTIENLTEGVYTAQGAEPNELVVWARGPQHEQVEQMVAEIDRELPEELQPVFETYTLNFIEISTAERMLELAMPGLRVSDEDDQNALVVWASPADQLRVQEILAQLDTDKLDEGASTAVVYTLDALNDREVVYAYRMIAQAVPGVVLAQGGDEGRLVAFARPREHEQLALLIEQLTDRSPETTEVMKIYDPAPIDAATAINILEDAFEQIEFSIGLDSGQLIAWAKPVDHEALSIAVDELKNTPPSANAPTMEVYELTSGDILSATAAVGSIAPDAIVQPGTDPMQLPIWATVADHEKIKDALSKLNDASPRPELAAIDLITMDVVAALGAARAISPESFSFPGSDPSKILVWGRPTDIERIRQAIAEIDAEPNLETAARFETYALAEITPTAAIQLISMAIPAAQVVPGTGADDYQLLVWARPTEHVRIADVLTKVDVDTSNDENSPTTVTYNMQGMTIQQSIYILRFLREVVPGIESTLNVVDPTQLVVTARPSEHEVVGELVEQLTRRDPAVMPFMEAYTLETIDATRAITMLGSVAPTATISEGVYPSQLIVWGRPADHEEITKALAAMSTATDPALAPTLESYVIESGDVAGAILLLASVVPDAELSVGERAKQLLAWARPSDHEKIATTIATLAEANPAPTLATYPIRYLELDAAENVLEKVMPDLRITPEINKSELMIWGTDEEHARVVQILVDLDVEGAEDVLARAKSYSLAAIGERGAYYGYRLLSQAAPRARFTIGVDPTQLIVWATPQEHEKLAEVVEQITTRDPETSPTMKVYALKQIDATEAIGFLGPSFPTVIFSVGTDERQLYVQARSDDHILVEQAITAMTEVDTSETRPTMRLYPLGDTSYISVFRILSQLTPRADLLLGLDLSELLVWADPEDHEKIAATIDAMRVSESEETAPCMRSYSLNGVPFASVVSMFARAAPNAIATLGVTPQQIVVWARPIEHEKVQELLDQMSDRGPVDALPSLVTYTVRTPAIDAALLLGSIAPNAQFGYNSDPHQILVWASPTDHEAIRTAVEGMDAPVEGVAGREAHVYRFERASASVAYEAIQELAPLAQVSYDIATQGLVVTATPEEHELIAAFVEEIDRAEPERQRSIQIHRVVTADVLDVYQVVNTLYNSLRDPQFMMTLDADNRALIVNGLPAQHERIRELIDEIEEGSLGDPEVMMSLYSLQNIDSYTALDLIDAQMENLGYEIDASVDRINNQLVVLARPEQHTMIQEILDSLKTEDREMEVFQLDVVDLTAAETAIRRMFEDESILSAPSIDVDEYTNQMFIRGSRKHLDQIRDLLIKMGERSLSSSSGAVSGRMRTIRIEGDTTALIEELQKRWPEISGNSLQILSEAGATPITVPGTTPTTPQEPAPTPPPGSTPPPPQTNGGETTNITIPGRFEETAYINPRSTVATTENTVAADPSSIRSNERIGSPGSFGPQGDEGPQGAVAKATVLPEPLPAQDASSNVPPEVTPEEPTLELAPSVPGAPVFMVIGRDGSLTLASDDLDALDKLESLIDQLTSRVTYEGRDYSVFRVEHVAASQVVQSLMIPLRDRVAQVVNGQVVPQRGGTGYTYGSARRNSIVIIPDDRLNTIYVQGTKSDRDEVEQLLRTLDVARLPGLALLEPTMISVKNTNAYRIQQLVMQAFQTQLISTRMPGGGTGQIGVDVFTNSLMVVAPEGLTEDIRRFVEKQDLRIAEEPAEQLHLIELEKVNSQRMYEALQSILRMSSYPSATVMGAPQQYNRGTAPAARPQR